MRNSYSKYTTGRREFASAGRSSVDGSRAAKLFSSNYYRPPSNDGVLANRVAILKIFKGRDVIRCEKGAIVNFLRRE